MDLKEEFIKAKFIKNKMDRLKETLESRNIGVSAIDITKEAVQTSNQSDLSDSVLKLNDIKQQIYDCEEKLKKYNNFALEQLDILKKEDEYNLMFKRYIQFKCWGEISVEMHFGIRWVYRLHGRALQKIKEYSNRPLISHQ